MIKASDMTTTSLKEPITVGSIIIPPGVSREESLVAARQSMIDKVYGDLDRRMQLLEQDVWDMYNSGGQPYDVAKVATKGIGELREMIAACAKVEGMP